jgi:hypothetical protein
LCGVIVKQMKLDNSKQFRFAMESVTSNPSNLSVMSDQIKNNKEIVLRAVSVSSGAALLDASDTLRNDANFVLSFIKHHPRALKFASEHLRNNREFIAKALRQNPIVLRHVSDAFKDDLKIIGIAVVSLKKQNRRGSVLQFASERIRNYKPAVEKVIKINGHELEGVSDNYKNDPTIVYSAISNTNGWALRFASERLRNNDAFIQKAVQKGFHSLRFASDHLRGNEQIVSLAVEANVQTLGFARDSVKNDENFIIKTVLEKNGMNLQHLNEAMKDNKKLVLAAVKKQGLALQFASLRLKKDQDIARAAFINCTDSLPYTNFRNIRNNKEFMFSLIRYNWCAFKFSGWRVKEDREIVEYVMRQEGARLKRNYNKRTNKKTRDMDTLFKLAHPTLKNDRDFILRLVKHNSLVYLHAGVNAKYDREVLLTTIKPRNDHIKLNKRAQRVIRDSSVFDLFLKQKEEYPLEHYFKYHRRGYTLDALMLELLVSASPSKTFPEQLVPGLIEFIPSMTVFQLGAIFKVCAKGLEKNHKNQNVAERNKKNVKTGRKIRDGNSSNPTKKTNPGITLRI